MAGHEISGRHGAVEADAGASRGAVGLDAPAVRLEIELRVLARNAALDCIALRLRNGLLRIHDEHKLE